MFLIAGFVIVYGFSWFKSLLRELGFDLGQF